MESINLATWPYIANIAKQPQPRNVTIEDICLYESIIIIMGNWLDRLSFAKTVALSFFVSLF